MKPMNQNQARYAMKRVNEIRSVIVTRITKKHTTVSKVTTNKAKKRAIVDGDYNLRYRGWDLDTPIGEAVNFLDIPDESTLDETGYRKDIEKLRKEAAKVTDEIMLGDAFAAKKLLAAFEKKTN